MEVLSRCLPPDIQPGNENKQNKNGRLSPGDQVTPPAACLLPGALELGLFCVSRRANPGERK